MAETENRKFFCFIFALLCSVFSLYGQNDGVEYLIANDGFDSRLLKNISSEIKDEPEDFKETSEQKNNIVSVEKDSLKLVLNGRCGTFGFFVRPDNREFVPVLTPYDNMRNSFFSVKFGNSVYQLTRRKGILTEARETDSGAQISYTIPNLAQVVLDFGFMPSVASSSRLDMLRCTVFIINLTPESQTVELKAIFDTMLGESFPAHFTTNGHSRIISDIQFRSMKDELWIRSGNPLASVQFLLHGEGITSPTTVTLSNIDQLDSSGWVPRIQSGRSFSSVMSYNNSGIAVNWNELYLDPLKTGITTFYISFATDGNPPAGKEFLASLEKGTSALLSNSKPKETTDVVPEPVQLSNEEIEKAFSNRAKELNFYSGKEPVRNKIAEPEAEYIQHLLDRIYTLENSGLDPDYEEIRALNNEIDMILQKLEE